MCFNDFNSKILNACFSHVSSVILASREQLCINEQLAHVADKNQMCRVKIRTRSCQYYNNIERNTGGASAGTSSALGPSGSSGSDHLTVGIGQAFLLRL